MTIKSDEYAIMNGERCYVLRIEGYGTFVEALVIKGGFVRTVPFSALRPSENDVPQGGPGEIPQNANPAPSAG
jgi:hypothetical protein